MFEGFLWSSPAPTATLAESLLAGAPALTSPVGRLRGETSPLASEPLPRALRWRLSERFPLLCDVEAPSGRRGRSVPVSATPVCGGSVGDLPFAKKSFSGGLFD
jgi:hypothetical protein